MPKMFGVKFPLPVLSEKIVYVTYTHNPPAGSTVYIACLDQVGEDSTLGNYNASETSSVVNYLVVRSGLLKNLVVRTGAVAGAGQTFVYIVRVNGANTAITCTISGAVAVTASDLINTAEVIVGDRITIQAVISAAASATQHSASLAMDTPSTRRPYEHIWFNSGATIPTNVTKYLGSLFRMGAAGGYDSVDTSIYVNHLVTRKGTLKNFVVLASSVAGVGQTFVYTVEINGVPTAMTVTLSGNAQLTGTDIVNIIQVDPSNRITVKVVTSNGAAVATHVVSFDFEEGDYRAG